MFVGGTQFLVKMSEMEKVESFVKNLGMENPKVFSLDEIHIFTSNLSKRLGSGGFGDVYEGILPEGVQVAVKVLKGEALSDVTKDQLKAEVGVLCRTHHRNLVKLYGFCFEHKMTALVYEFMENKSLDTILYGNQRIEWETICNIAIGTATGLSYLHKDCQPSIIHYDIKPNNILLDSKLNPKIGDFGLAMRLSQGKSHITLSGMRGTLIYVAPEITMPISPINGKCDVYSYGITLFDLIGRRKHPLVVDKNWFPVHVWKQFAKKQEDVIMEECGIQEKDRERAKRMLMIALKCVQFEPKDRPSMSCVLRLLEGSEEVKMPPNPFVHLASSSGTKIESSTPKAKMILKQEKNVPKNDETHLYIKVARDEDLVEQYSRDIFTDLLQHDNVWCYRIKKSTAFNIFKEIAAKKFGVAVQFQRYWLWGRCKDKAYRPKRPLTLKEEETLSVDEVREIYHRKDLLLFLEVQQGPDLGPIKLPKISSRDIMIFVQRPDKRIRTLCYVGKLFVDKNSMPSEVLTKLKVMAGFSSSETTMLGKKSSEVLTKLKVMAGFSSSETTMLSKEISLGSHIGFMSVEMNMTFEDNKFIDGDILCIDKYNSYIKKQFYTLALPREPRYLNPNHPYYSSGNIPYGNPHDLGYPINPYGYPEGSYSQGF